ncbi:MAG: PrsW family intramembrane metalloprotease [Parasporobacterium sp.]|nr:PrsW family intramembrane metalloprotease [Parasporobacterium sp.]
MFYFLMMPYMAYRWILILAALVPAVFLMIKVYRSDRLESESGPMLRSLVLAGILATLAAMVLERIGEGILGAVASESSTTYQVILYFVIVAFAEEGTKYAALRIRTWKSPEFDCQYDGVVYAVFVSLGFALWENISYVLHFGFSTALVRAVTAIPGHACFGVFMGIFYGLAKGYQVMNDRSKSKLCLVLSVVVPALIHGTYDYIATSQTSGEWGFILFIAVLFAVSYYLVNKMAKNDRYFESRRSYRRSR